MYFLLHWSCRAFFLGRDKEGRKAWRHSAEVQELLRETIRSVLEEIYDKHGEVRQQCLHISFLTGLLWCDCSSYTFPYLRH